MHKHFQRDAYFIGDIVYLAKCEFPGKHSLGKPDIFQKTDFFRSAVVALGACVQLYRGDVHAQDTHVLDYQGVHSGMVERCDEAFGLGKLAVVYYGVDGGIHLDIERMGPFHHTPYVVNAVGGIFARAKDRSPDVHGIRTGKNRTYGGVGILGWGEEFQWGRGCFLSWHAAKLVIRRNPCKCRNYYLVKID